MLQIHHPPSPSDLRPMPVQVTDDFSTDVPAGQVIGSRSASGALRYGADQEGVMGIDHGALRLGFPQKAGWGRHGIAYGPYTRTPGRVFAVHMINGHNTSQTDEFFESFPRRWVRKLAWWVLRRTGTSWLKRVPPNPPIPYSKPAVTENLAVGWFPDDSPQDPTRAGNGFIMHATGPENGELWTRVGERVLPVIRSVQNIPIYYVTVLRAQGAAYYVSSVSGANGMPAYPNMRPVGIDPFGSDEQLYAGVHQSVLGEGGFMIDSRVYGAQVADVQAWSAWYGGAHLAERGVGEGMLEETSPDMGTNWHVEQGVFTRTEKGLSTHGTHNLALLSGAVPSGLVHAVLETGATVSTMGLHWRVEDAQNHWSVEVGPTQAQLVNTVGGERYVIATDTTQMLSPNTVYSLQVLDTGSTFGIHLDGHLVFGIRFSDLTGQTACGIGIRMTGTSAQSYIRSIEAHPRELRLPDELDLGPPWQPDSGPVVVRDHFDGSSSPLEGTTTATGGKRWERTIGTGEINLTGTRGACVDADVDHPCPGRTVYTLPWDDPGYADVEIDVIPPGTQRGEGHKGRGALVFWQDEANYLIINNFFSDRYEGRAISSFFHFAGEDDLYRAVWANIGDRIHWGQSFTFRVVFDGMHYQASVNGEPVLYRALTDVYPGMKPLKINRIGFGVNWEFGDDTGTRFSRFEARWGHKGLPKNE